MKGNGGSATIVRIGTKLSIIIASIVMLPGRRYRKLKFDSQFLSLWFGRVKDEIRQFVQDGKDVDA